VIDFHDTWQENYAASRLWSTF